MDLTLELGAMMIERSEFYVVWLVLLDLDGGEDRDEEER